MVLWEELKRRNVFKVAAAYLIAAWLVAQVVSVVNEPLSLPSWFDTVTLLLLAIGFPFALILAWAYDLTPGGLRRTGDSAVSDAAQPSGRRRNFVPAALLIGAALGAGTIWLVNRDSDERWFRDEVVPQLEAYIDLGNWEGAYDLATEAEARVPGNPELADLWPRFSWLVTIPSNPPGATVYRRPYGETTDEWERLGVTPIEDAHIPFGLSSIRFELDGYETLVRTLGGGGFADEVLISNYINVGPDDYRLDRVNTLPEGKVRVPGWTETVAGEEISFADFFLDRYEVTNSEYSEFMDAGGYERRDYWVHPFLLNGQEIPWEDAMRRFVDVTGQPGPRNWEAGDFPDGRENYPVTGVSWYEAAAYARWKGDELPTFHHWRRAYSEGTLTWLFPESNIDGDSVAPVGEYDGMSWPGTYDMVGNAREWAFNATGGNRFILGAGWNDAAYTAMNLRYAQPPMDRSATNGFRLMRSEDSVRVIEQARTPLPDFQTRDVLAEEPFSDELLEAYSETFDYIARPLASRIEEAEIVSTRNWTREKISFNAGYDNERMIMYLFLPSSAPPPFKTVVYWPGSNALGHNSIDDYPEVHIDFILKSGRAVAFPVLDGTFERGDRSPHPDIVTTAYRDAMIRRIKDLRVSIDYLETRDDIDVSTLGYYGLSWGGWNSPIILAVEPRLRSAVLYAAYIVPLVGSFWSSNEEPGGRMDAVVDPVTYLPSVSVPTLMLNGEYDHLGPLEESVRPFFELLGTPEEDKALIIEPGGHFVPRTVLIRETLDWLDRYQGAP